MRLITAKSLEVYTINNNIFINLKKSIVKIKYNFYLYNL